MYTDPAAIARMSAMSLLLGVLLELFLEVLRLAGGFISPKTLARHGKTEGIASFIWLLIRDIVFFTVSGAVFSVFVYYSNNGNVRLTAVIGTLAGFLLCYFTLGRLLRRVSELIIRTLYRLIYILTYPLRLLIRAVTAAAGRLSAAARHRKMVLYTGKEIKRAASVREYGMPR